tara:strand:+ start:99 stop:578 length:480 start_codon:yes stop_codon:yes gene_type:complete
MFKYFSLFYTHKISVFISIITIILDQLSKFLIIIFLPLGNSWPQEGILRFTHARNTGAAFSLFQDQSLILSIVSVIAVIFILFVFKSINNPSLLIRITFGLQIGGAFGNLIDRFRLGYVTDFIDFGWWPIFNIADSSIVVGITIMIFYFLFTNENKKNE